LLQIGSIDITKVSSGVLENFVPEYKVLGLPYIFKNREHQFNILDGPVGHELLQAGEKYWLRGLGYYDSGSRSFYTKDKSINTPADLRGLKIRTMESPTAMNMVKQMGGAATPISFGELYTALQAGVVDGAENNPPSLYLTRHYEICKYYSIDEHTSLPDVLLISTHTWNSLTEQEQAWLTEAVEASVVYQRKLWKEAETHALKQLEKEGVKISYPDKAPFIEIVQPLYRQYENEPDIARLIHRIKEIK
jgi:tripartite ATP-independent transporter DctP family solute receptor